MDYRKIREINAEKKTRRNECVAHVRFDLFSVCFTRNGTCFLVDNDVVDLVAKRMWCISHGYPATRYGNELIRLHDFVMAWHFEEKPIGVYVDHVNQIKTDNRIKNLRFVTPLENSLNVPIKSDNTSGATGVSRTKYGKFRAYITINKRQIGLGTYANIEDAINSRKEAEERLGFFSRPTTIKELLEKEALNDPNN